MTKAQLNDIEILDKMEKDLHNLGAKYDVHNNVAANQLRRAAKEIRQAIERLKGSYSPPSPDSGL